MPPADAKPVNQSPLAPTSRAHARARDPEMAVRGGGCGV